MTLVMADSWDEWLGHLSLTGQDPRTWDLNRLLAAFEAHLRQNSKDEAAWRRKQSQLTAEPRKVRDQRRRTGRAPAARMSVDGAEALLARMAASEAAFGAQ